MPVQSCTEDGKSGFRWGTKGKCYTYPANDEKAMGKAKEKAYLQGYAATKGTMKEDAEDFVLEQFEPPEAGNAPKGVKDILKGVYNSCRVSWAKDHPDDKENAGNKESCAKQAWGAVSNAGWIKVNNKWTKKNKTGKKEGIGFVSHEI